jgi:hypothetical protein
MREIACVAVAVEYRSQLRSPALWNTPPRVDVVTAWRVQPDVFSVEFRRSISPGVNR